MMDKLRITTIIFLAFISFIGSCQLGVEREKHIVIDTEYGEIVFRLYNETPLHRDNFLNLVSDSFYNNQLGS